MEGSEHPSLALSEVCTSLTLEGMAWMELKSLVKVMCCVYIAGDGSSRTFQCGRWITPSSSQPLSLATSTLQHSCCPACSIADSGVTALPVRQALLLMWLRHQSTGALSFSAKAGQKLWGKVHTSPYLCWSFVIQHLATLQVFGRCQFSIIPLSHIGIVQIEANQRPDMSDNYISWQCRLALFIFAS